MNLNILIVFVTFVLVATAGIETVNLLADQATIRDCATKGHAVMKGGGVIECTVKKEIAK